jgi:hypothetical protein
LLRLIMLVWVDQVTFQLLLHDKQPTQPWRSVLPWLWVTSTDAQRVGILQPSAAPVVE